MDARDVRLEPGRKTYTQEGRAGLFQVMLPYLTTTTRMQEYLPLGWGEGIGHCKRDYLTALVYEDNMERVAKAVLERVETGEVARWLEKWHAIDSRLTQASRALVDADMSAFGFTELRARYEELYELDMDMWAISIFIDVFDAGHDQHEIDRIAAQYAFSSEEVHILTTPSDPTFVSVWEDLVLRFAAGEVSLEQVKERFFWNGTTYSEWHEVDEAFIRAVAAKAHPLPPSQGDSAVAAILAQRGLAANPLDFFRSLTQWRDERKRLNYTGLYGLIKILREVGRRQGISPKYLNGLVPEQAAAFFAGTISEAQLQRQLDEDFCISIRPDGRFYYFFGDEAARLWERVSAEAAPASHGESLSEIRGVIASRGKATGRVRILLDFNDPRAASFEAGDILVTSMTRPEFLPLMKLAAAFVTNEGGITSHAAIVAREMKKPCIIGTKIATQVLKDGDMVEVDAEVGVVRLSTRRAGDSSTV